MLIDAQFFSFLLKYTSQIVILVFYTVMKCRKHPTDLSSNIGVCATCLRDRLLIIIAAQEKQNCRKSDSQQQQHPLPLPFPSSVSPYMSRRKSEILTAGSTWQLNQHQQRFYSTPQVRPTGSIEMNTDSDKKWSRRNISSIFMGLFRSKKKSGKLDTYSAPISDPCVSEASPAWKRQFRTFSLDEGISIGAQPKIGRNRNKGMSPAKNFNDDDEHCGSSGYSSESSQGYKQTPQRTPMRRGGWKAASTNSKNLSVFCLSPLVRPSPNRHRNQKCMPPETTMSGEFGAQVKPHLFTTASFCKNRSRKLADIGRYNHNPNH